jgi:hypothetical protein
MTLKDIELSFRSIVHKSNDLGAFTLEKVFIVQIIIKNIIFFFDKGNILKFNWMSVIRRSQTFFEIHTSILNSGPWMSLLVFLAAAGMSTWSRHNYFDSYFSIFLRAMQGTIHAWIYCMRRHKRDLWRMYGFKDEYEAIHCVWFEYLPQILTHSICFDSTCTYFSFDSCSFFHFICLIIKLRVYPMTLIILHMSK